MGWKSYTDFYHTSFLILNGYCFRLLLTVGSSSVLLLRLSLASVLIFIHLVCHSDSQFSGSYSLREWFNMCLIESFEEVKGCNHDPLVLLSSKVGGSRAASTLSLWLASLTKGNDFVAHFSSHFLIGDA